MTRAEQKVFLRTIYPDYDPRRHDAFVQRYQKEQEAEALRAYEQERGIVPHSADLAHASDIIIKGQKIWTKPDMNQPQAPHTPVPMGCLPQ